MPDRYKLSEGRSCPLRQTALGFSPALVPPKIYLPSQRGYKYVEATEIHERCHGTLINSTIYGIAEQILFYLLKAGCPHIERQILDQAYKNLMRESFNVHEGCATLCAITHIESTQPENIDDFKATHSDNYLKAVSRFSTAIDLFGFHGYLRDWLAIQIAAVCLCPPLFGPLSNYENYKSGKIISIFSDEKFSPDKRLDKIINDGKSGQLSKLINDVKNVIEDSIKKTFPPSRKPDFDNDLLRHNFIHICEHPVENCFAKAYPKFYVNYHVFLKEWKVIWLRIVSESQEAGCDCLSNLHFKHVDLLEGSELVRPVAIPDRRGHLGAIKLDKLSDLPFQKNEQYYIALNFNEKPETEIVCDNPPRLLREGHLYTRFQKFHEAEGISHFENFYWFKFFTPLEIPSALTSIAKIPRIVVCPMCGYRDRLLERLKECNRYSIRNIYLQIDGITAERFTDFVKVLPSPTYEMFVAKEKNFQDQILYLKDTVGNFHVILPVTSETLTAIVEKANHLDKIEKRRASPAPADRICFFHLSTSGW